MSGWLPGQSRGNPPVARFNELLDQIKLEFNNQHERAESNDQSRKSLATVIFAPTSSRHWLLLEYLS